MTCFVEIDGYTDTWSTASLEEGRSLLSRLETSRIASRPTGLSKVHHHFDSDQAGCSLTRKSTTHTDKATRNLQSSIGLNVSEARYYKLCRGAARGFVEHGKPERLRVESQSEVTSDSSSARSNASRRGLGPQRHVQTRFLWLQERKQHEHLKGSEWIPSPI